MVIEYYCIHLKRKMQKRRNKILKFHKHISPYITLKIFLYSIFLIKFFNLLLKNQIPIFPILFKYLLNKNIL
jgi:hypothetical protein